MPSQREHRRLLHDSWSTLEPRREEVAASFDGLLLELDAEAGALFGGPDVEERRRALADLVRDIAVSVSCEDPRPLVRAAVAWGRRHAAAGVRDEHYQHVGAALMRALERALGADFTPELRGAWSDAYLLASAIMRRTVSAQGARQ